MRDRDYSPGPHRSDDAPAPEPRRTTNDLSVPPSAKTARRAERVYRCAADGCAGVLDLTREDTPERLGWRGKNLLSFPCGTCGALKEITEEDAVRCARTVARAIAPSIMHCIAVRSRRLHDLMLAMDDEKVAVPGPLGIPMIANPGQIADVAKAALAHDTVLVKAAGLQGETVEVTHRFQPAEDDPEVLALAEEIARREFDKINRVIDVKAEPAKAKP